MARFPFADRLLVDSPALSWRPGQTPTHDASCGADGNASAPGPISAMICCAESTPKPGSSAKRTTASSCTFMASAIMLSSSAICASITSSRCRYSSNSFRCSGCGWLEELLRLLRNAFGAAGSGSVDTTQIAIRDLETTEATCWLERGLSSAPARHVSHCLPRLARLTTLVGPVTQPTDPPYEDPHVR